MTQTTPRTATPRRIKFLNLPEQQRALQKPLLAAIQRVLAGSH